MVLVILAALCVAAFVSLFKVIGRLGIPLLPAIAVNYFVAFACGLLISRPWSAGDLSLLWFPSIGLGSLFVCMFFLTGVSAQRAGVARTTVAGRMSLVITVLGAVRIFHEQPGALGWIGIALALIGLVLATWNGGPREERASWKLPMLIFFGSGVCDIAVNAVQRTRTTSLTEAVFPTLCFGAASLISSCWVIIRKENGAWRSTHVLIAGTLLGLVNYASLQFLIGALAHSGMPASSVFPLMNIGAILFGTAASVLLFRDRLQPRQWTGIAVCVAALALIMAPHA